MAVRIFCVFLLFLSARLNGTLTFESITKGMNTLDLKGTGLEKLTDSERERLNAWFEHSAPDYFIKVPIAENAGDMPTVYKQENLPSGKASQKEHWSLALAAPFQHEAPYLREFIEFYKMLGVQHFYLYNNRSNDDYLAVLREYIKEGEVELIEWPMKNPSSCVPECYSDAVERAKGKADWLVLAEASLFIYPKAEPTLTGFLKKYDYPQIAGVVANMARFGTSGVVAIAPDELLTELLIYREKEIDRHVRCIVRPDRVVKVENPHFAQYKQGCFAVDENFTRVEGPFNERKPCSKLKANQYALRTEEYLYGTLGLRHARQQAVSQDIPPPNSIPADIYRHYESLDALYSESMDADIQRFVPELKKRLSVNL